VGTISSGIAGPGVENNSKVAGSPTWISDIQYALAVSLQLPHLARELRLSFSDWLERNLDLGHEGISEFTGILCPKTVKRKRVVAIGAQPVFVETALPSLTLARSVLLRPTVE
jgi:hypothetical protein